MGPDRGAALPLCLWGLERIHGLFTAHAPRGRRLGLGISNTLELEENVMCHRNVREPLDSIRHYSVQLDPPFQPLIQKWNDICQKDFRTLPMSRLQHLTSCEVTSPSDRSQFFKSQGLGNVKTISDRGFENWGGGSVNVVKNQNNMHYYFCSPIYISKIILLKKKHKMYYV